MKHPAVFAILCCLFWPVQSDACSCGNGLISGWPFVGAPDAWPLNPRIPVSVHVSVGEAPDIRVALRDPDANEVAVSVSLVEWESGHLAMVTPDSLLAPDTTYSLEVASCSNAFCDRIAEEVRTGNAVDDEVPPLPQVEVTGKAQYHSSGLCGAESWIGFSADYDGMLLVDVEGDATFDPATLSGYVNVVTDAQEFSLGVGMCQVGLPPEGGNLTFRFGVLSAGGNFSGWTEPQTIYAPELLSCAVGRVGRRSTSLWSLLTGDVL